MPRRAVLLAALAAAAVAFLVHARTLEAGFVHDDHRFVEHNAAIRSIDVVRFFRDPATASAEEGIQPDIWRPLRTLDYAVAWSLFGADPGAWHLENLLWHALNAALVFLVLRPLLRGAVLPALAGALLFAVHPVTSESVAWISSRGDLMALTGVLLALLVTEREGWARTAGGAVLLLLACLAKESAIVAPALLPLRDLALPAAAAPRRRTTWVRTAAFAGTVGAYLLLRMQVIPDLAQLREFPGGSREATARSMAAGIAWYAGDLVWPTGFRFDYFQLDPFTWSAPEVVLGLAVLASAALLGAWGAATGRWVLAFASWGALACLVPVSNVLVPLKAIVAERFLYPVLLGVAAGVGAALLAAPGRWRRPLLAATAVAVVLLGSVTWRRDAAWAGEVELWDAVRRDRPEHPRSYEGLGFEALEAGRTERAERYYRSYLEHNPDDGKSWAILGDLFGDVARSLVLTTREPGTETDIDARRHQARAAQLSAYRAALAAWDRVGLVRGRGSPRLVAEVQAKRIEAAIDLGALREAKIANDASIRSEGLDPAARDEVLARASYLARSVRWTLALVAVTRPRPPPGRDAEFLADRAALLADVGIEATTRDEEVLRRLEPVFADLGRERPGDLATRWNHVVLLERLGREAEARALEAEIRGRGDR